MTGSKIGTLIKRVDSHLGKAAALTAAGVGGVVMMAPSEADAVVVSSGPVNLVIPSTTAGFYLNVVTGVNAITPGAVPGWDLNPWGSTSFNIWANNGASLNDGVVGSLGSSTSLVDNLAIGTLVDGSLGYSRSSGIETTGATAFNLNSSNNYFGFRFQDEAAGCQKFGWGQVSLGATQQAQPRTLVQYAYENDCGVGITVPEPASLGLLALGALGLIRRRRQVA